MSNQRVLIVEDDERSGKLLRDVLVTNYYDAILVINGKLALEEFKKNPFNVVITDIEMPVMDGNELISHLKVFEYDPVIFVTTAHKEASVIIDIMKKGVYDYLIKPVDVNDILIKVKRAFETFELRKMKGIIEKEKTIRMENQIEWIKWQERIKNRGTSKSLTHKTMFNSLRTSFTQGAGFGSMTTLFNMIFSSARKEGDHFVVEIEEELMNLFNENTKMAEKAVNIFSDIEWIMTNEISKEKKSCNELHVLLKQTIGEMSQYEGINNNMLILSEKKPGFDKKYLRINTEFFHRALCELFINAIKFSEIGSKIYVILDVQHEQSIISIINQSQYNEDYDIYGIPPEYANIIFEPFFRISNSVFEQYNTLDFGLGLTEVEKIIEKHDGKSLGRITRI